MSYENNNQEIPSGSFIPATWPTAEELARATSSCLTKVFLRMFAALVVTAIAAYSVAASLTVQILIFGNMFVFFGLIIVEFILVIVISARINKLSPTAANVMFFLYAIINGLTLSSIFIVYEIGIIYQAFAVAALMFAAMALYGSTTRRDLTSIGSLCLMGLFGIIIASLVNIFFRSEMFDMMISYIGVFIFIGLTAYDTQRTKRMLADANSVSHAVAIQRISVIGALSLYLNFINLFLRLLRILGRRR